MDCINRPETPPALPLRSPPLRPPPLPNNTSRGGCQPGVKQEHTSSSSPRRGRGGGNRHVKKPRHLRNLRAATLCCSFVFPPQHTPPPQPSAPTFSSSSSRLCSQLPASLTDGGGASALGASRWERFWFWLAGGRRRTRSRRSTTGSGRARTLAGPVT